MKTIGDVLKGGSDYNSPQWQELGKTIRRELGNSCHCCRRSDKVTHVHHLSYEPGKKLWEYPREELILLCSDCHAGLTKEIRNFRKFVFGNLDPNAFRVLNGALAAGLAIHRDPNRWAYCVAGLAANPGLADYCYKRATE